MLDDAQLFRRYAEENSEEAFAVLVTRNLDLVYSAALRQLGGDAHRAKDVAQVVFVTPGAQGVCACAPSRAGRLALHGHATHRSESLVSPRSWNASPLS